MAKLKCEKHDRRLLIIGDKWLHRTGDMSECDDHSARIGKERITSVSIFPRVDPAQRLLYEIFRSSSVKSWDLTRTS